MAPANGLPPTTTSPPEEFSGRGRVVTTPGVIVGGGAGWIWPPAGSVGLGPGVLVGFGGGFVGLLVGVLDGVAVKRGVGVDVA